MKKTEYIERYGIEWYEAYKERNRVRYNECYKELYRKRGKELYNIDEKYTLNKRLGPTLYRYCRRGEESKIENYELAKADNFKGWVIHHRLEMTLDGDFSLSVDDLKRMNMYYNRPYFELIFIRRNEHMKLHKGNKYNG